jgi:hypothetical protein
MSDIAGIPYLIARFDKDGTLQNEVTLPQGITDLFVISHGWNNTQEDAENLYKDLFKNVAAVAPELLSRKLAILGIIWPSKKFTELVNAAATQGGAASMEGAAVADQTLVKKLDKLEELFGPKSAARIQKAKGLIEKLETDPAARDEFVSQLVGLLDPGAAHKEDASDKLFNMNGSKMLEKLQVPTPITPTSSGGAAGGATALAGSAPTPMAAGGAAGLGDVFSGIKAGATRFLNYLTYYEMKARAGTVGKGVGQLLDKLSSSVERIYLIGHSFGSRVVSAAAMSSTTPKIQSMALLQAAFSHNSFSANFDDSDLARPGFFREVVNQGRVRGPILVTHTPNDTAVGILYPAASRLSGTVASAFGDKDDKFGGLGRNGAQKMKKSEIAASVNKLLPVGRNYGWEPGKFHNLESSDFIRDPKGGDAHGVVTGKEIAWAISRTVI